jgi:hypothetical protein
MGTIFDWYLTHLRASAIVPSLVASQVNLFSTVAFTHLQTFPWWYWRSTEEAIARA